MNQKEKSDSFGIEGLKNLITDDKKTIQKILSGIEKIKRTDNKITLVQAAVSLKIGHRICAHVVKVHNNYASALIIYKVNRPFSFLPMIYFP